MKILKCALFLLFASSFMQGMRIDTALMHKVELIAKDEAMVQVHKYLLDSSEVFRGALRSYDSKEKKRKITFAIPADGESLKLFAKGLTLSHQSVVGNEEQKKKAGQDLNDYIDSLSIKSICKIENIIDFLNIQSPLQSAVRHKLSNPSAEDRKYIEKLNNPVEATSLLMEPLIKKTKENYANKVVAPIVTINNRLNNNVGGITDGYEDLIVLNTQFSPCGKIIAHDNSKVLIYNAQTGKQERKINFNGSGIGDVVSGCLHPTWGVEVCPKGDKIAAFTTAQYKERQLIHFEQCNTNTISQLVLKNIGIWPCMFVQCMPGNRIFGGICGAIVGLISGYADEGLVFAPLDEIRAFIRMRLYQRSQPGKLKIFDTSTGMLTCTITENGYLAVKFSKDGKRLAVAVDGRRLAIYDSSTGAQISTFVHGANDVYALEFSPDNKTITAIDNAKIYVWNSDAGAHDYFNGHTGKVLHMAFSNDGNQLLSTSADGTLRLWDMNNNQMTHTLQKHTNAVYYAEFCPNNNKTILSSSKDNTAIKWDAESGDVIYTFPSCTDAAKFSSDGTKILVPSSSKVDIYDACSHELLFTLEGNASNCNAYFSPDNKKVLGCSDQNREIKIWKLPEDCQKMSMYRYAINPDEVAVALSPKTTYPSVQFGQKDEQVLSKISLKGQDLLKVSLHDQKLKDMQAWKNKLKFLGIAGTMTAATVFAMKLTDPMLDEKKIYNFLVGAFWCSSAYTYGNYFFGDSLVRLLRYYS